MCHCASCCRLKRCYVYDVEDRIRPVIRAAACLAGAHVSGRVVAVGRCGVYCCIPSSDHARL